MIDDSLYVNISFRDNGCGVPAGIKDKLINPFFSTKPSGEGTGLGLSIIYGIIKDHRGEILIDSLEGEFTEITVSLPAWEEEK